MKTRRVLQRVPRWRFGLAWAMLAPLLTGGCYQPNQSARPDSTSKVPEFLKLYSENCSGCHGANGMQGPAPPLNNKLRLAIYSEKELEHIITAGQGTLMPPMNIKHGGSLTENQVGTLVSEMKREWGNPRPEIIPLEEETPTSTAAVSQGAKLFAQHCANCHGAEGRGGKAGALNDPAFLALVSPQGIRSLIITGRPDLTCDPKMPGYLDLVKVTPENAVSVGKEIDAICAYIQSWRKDRVSVTTPAPGTTEKPANQGTQP